MFLKEIRLWRTRRGEIDPLDFISDLETSSCKITILLCFSKKFVRGGPEGGNSTPQILFPASKHKVAKIIILLGFYRKFVRGGPEGGKSTP